jgi:hypothetical protein
MYNAQDVSGGIQAAIKNLASNNVFYFNIPISLEVVFAAGPGMEVAALAAAWKSIEDSQEASQLVNGEPPTPLNSLLVSNGSWLTLECMLCMPLSYTDLPTVDIEAVKSKLAAKDIAFVTKRDVPGQEGQQVAVYFSARTVTNASLLIELKFKTGMNICKVTVKSTNKGLSELCKAAVAKLLL